MARFYAPYPCAPEGRDPYCAYNARQSVDLISVEMSRSHRNTKSVFLDSFIFKIHVHGQMLFLSKVREMAWKTVTFVEEFYCIDSRPSDGHNHDCHPDLPSSM